jgi:hypothetical protein
LTLFSLPSRCAGKTQNATEKEVERLRAAGLKGVHRTRVKDKDYDTDLDTYNTNKGSSE